MSLRWSALFITIVGVVCVVFGIMFIIEAGNAEQRVTNEIAPINLTIGDVDAAYDQAGVSLGQAMQSGDSEIIQDAYIQKTSLGLVKSNIGTIKFVRNSGILEIALGVGLILASAGLFRRD